MVTKLQQGFQGAVKLVVMDARKAREVQKAGKLSGFGPGRGKAVLEVQGAVRVYGSQGFVEQARFLRADAVEAPTGSNHGLDGTQFEVVLRLEGGDVLLEEGVEFLLGLVFEDDAVGIEAVVAAITGGTQLSFGSSRAAGEGPVGS
jgi:hypothetical protein